MKKSNYFIRIGDALSQLANVVFLNGMANESISGRSYREGWKIAKVIDFVLGKEHCKKSYENDLSYSGWLLSNSKKDK